MDDNEALNEFLKVVEDAKLQFGALTLLSELIRIMVGQDDPNDMDPESLEKVIQAIISYGDRRVMDAMSK